MTLLVVGFGIYSYSIEIGIISSSFIGYVISEDIKGLQNENIIEKIDSEDVDLQISEPKKSFGRSILKNKNKRMEFSSVSGGEIRLYFDLLNYSEFIENTAEKLILENITNVSLIEDVEIIDINESVVDLNNTLNESLDTQIDLNVSNDTIVSGNFSDISNITTEGNESFVNESIKSESNVSEIENEDDIESELNQSIDVVSNGTVEDDVVSNEIDEESIGEGTETEEVEEDELEIEEEETETEEVEDEELEVESDVTESEPGITGGIIRFFRNSLGFAGRVVGIDFNESASDDGNISVSVIVEEVSLDDVKENFIELNDAEIDVILDESIIEAKDFEIVINETPGDKNDGDRRDEKYKWGYNVKLQDLQFMAKIDITAEETISIIDNETLKIGRKNLLSFKDLKDAGYNIRFEIPVLEINLDDIEVKRIVNQVVVEENSSIDLDNDNETETNETEDESNNKIQIIPSITGNVVSRILGLSIEEQSEIEDIKYENTVILYIERDFTNSNYGVGDIINLDPELIIILAIDAEHLDSNREFLSNIYDEIEVKDDIWSEVINDSEYVRVTFEKVLDKNNDITIYARSVDRSDSEVVVYRVDDNREVARFVNVSEEKNYKVYLEGLDDQESLDVFDIKVECESDGCGVEFDHIVDPSFYAEYFEDCASLTDATNWTEVGGDWAIVSGVCEAGGAGTDGNMTNNNDIDLSLREVANLSFNWSVNGLDAGEYFQVFVSNDSGSTWYKLFEFLSGAGGQSASGFENFNMEDNITLTTNVRLRGRCYCSGGDNCGWDNINVTGYDSLTVNIVYPQNTTYNYNVSELNLTSSSDSSISRCWYSNNSGVWNSSSITAGNNFTDVFSVEGSNIWTLYCNDSEERLMSDNVTFYIDTEIPVINLMSPTNASIEVNLTIYFSANFTDGDLKNATLNIWDSIGNLINGSENQSITGTSNSTNISVTLPYGSIFDWNYYVCDGSGNCEWNATNWTVTVDLPPTVNLVSPLNQSIVTSANSAYFVANHIDVELKNTTLYVWNSTGSSINITTETTTGSSNSTNISVVLPYNGTFSWNYYTCDNNNNCTWNATNWTLNYVFCLGQLMRTNIACANASWYGENGSDASGVSVSYAGDVNGDGYDDL
ncbi:hypothetical protein GOV12_06745, partial [Candidatus Pacearchaeota archaeon]|nr:hypothetical protein [Candidatus Pacearchaeota archaeon]